jgi:hypothetical protein
MVETELASEVVRQFRRAPPGLDAADPVAAAVLARMRRALWLRRLVVTASALVGAATAASVIGYAGAPAAEAARLHAPALLEALGALPGGAIIWIAAAGAALTALAGLSAVRDF